MAKRITAKPFAFCAVLIVVVLAAACLTSDRSRKQAATSKEDREALERFIARMRGFDAAHRKELTRGAAGTPTVNSKEEACLLQVIRTAKSREVVLTARLRLAHCYLDQSATLGLHKQAQELLAALRKKAPDSWQAALAVLLEADLTALPSKKGDYNKAVKHIKDNLKRFEKAELFDNTAARQFAKRLYPRSNYRVENWHARGLLKMAGFSRWAGHPEKQRELVEKVRRDFPGTAEAEHAASIYLGP